MIRSSLTRRVLMNRAAQIAALGAAGPLALSLAGMGEAGAMNAGGGYRALVCVFLYGGNDHANTVVPFDRENYARYARIRGGRGGGPGGIAYGYDQLVPTALPTPADQTLTDGLQYALSPSMPRMAGLFREGKAAVQLNVGPLIAPLTLQQYQSADRARYPLPPKLFSHNDQQSVWQALGSEGATIGWGGRLGDLALDANRHALLTCISASGNAVFVSGVRALQYQISPKGAIKVGAIAEEPYGLPGIGEALREIMTADSGHAYERELGIVARRSFEMEGVVNAAIAPVLLDNVFPAEGQNPLADQLKVVARLIGARETLGCRRQVFFVSLGGFDTHNELMADHPKLLSHVDGAIASFVAATETLGVANEVTTFTASDFGRTLSSNSDGSDHGWGSHHFIVGGAVKGGRYYGAAPHVSLKSDDQVGQGRLLPSTSVDQFAATLARWFGVEDSEMPSVLPNIGNFAATNLGFV